MEPIWTIIISSALTCLVTLVVSSIYNYFIQRPKRKKQEEQAEEDRICAIETREDELEDKVNEALDGVREYPKYREQSKAIQIQLQESDRLILETCERIQAGVDRNQEILNMRLDRLEKRERNALRAKILNEHRLFADPNKNPMKAWSEMEHHSFFELVHDYEELGGNDYVHSVVIPEMNKLHIIPMSNLDELEKLFNSRHNI